MPYNDEIIQISGGMNDFIGKLDQTLHPMGENWYRIKDPCITFMQKNEEKKVLQTVIARMSGPPGAIAFRKFVDIRIPECDPVEIRVVDKKGPLYKYYKEEIDRKEPSNIIVPDLTVVPGK